MNQPKLKVGDTFVYTEEMNEDKRQNGGLDRTVGSNVTVRSIGLDADDSRMQYYGANGYIYDVEFVDLYLPANPRTLDDVKKGDVLVDRDGAKWVVVARTGQVVLLCAESNAIPWPFTIDLLKERNYKFADQPEERWKPEGMYWYVEENSKGEFYAENTYWTNDKIDNKLWERGNCFKTKEEAEKAAEDLKEFWKKRLNDNQK